MSQGIVKVTPKPGALGVLQITVADSNPFGVKVGDLLTFAAPRFSVSVGDIVDCIIDSATTSTVTRVVVLAPPIKATAGVDS